MNRPRCTKFAIEMKFTDRLLMAYKLVAGHVIALSRDGVTYGSLVS